MKKLFLIVSPLIFLISCGGGGGDIDPEITGCMDPTADNYNADANTELSNSCTFSAEVTYFLFASASAEMILNNVPYVFFYDNFGNSMGTITYEWYYNSILDVPCAPTNATLHSGITWTGNSNTPGANFVYHIHLNDGSYFATGNFDVSAGECMKVGFYFTKEMLEKLQNR